MLTNETKAKGELSIFTEVIWSHNDISSLMLVPDGTFNILIVNYPCVIDGHEADRGIYFIPVLKRTVTIKTDLPVYGLRLKIFSLHNLIQCNNIPVEMTKEIFKLDLPENLSKMVHSRTSEASGLSQCLSTLENLNYELIHKNYEVNLLMRDRVNYILDRKGDVQVKEMCEHFGISRQALHKSFKNTIGIGPKDLGTIWRLNHFIWKLKSEDKLSDSAYDVGYYDQAHSIKEFQSKYAINPSMFIKEQWTTYAYINATIEKRFTNFYDPDLLK